MKKSLYCLEEKDSFLNEKRRGCEIGGGVVSLGVRRRLLRKKAM